MTDTLHLLAPDDWHLHLRDGDVLKDTVPHTAAQFNRAIVMPNLVPPVVRVEQARDYRERILPHIPSGSAFEPLMTLYLTEQTEASEIAAAAASDFVHAVKLYPAGATTNSDAGVRQLKAVYPVFEAMQKHGLPLLLHGEVTHAEVDIFDREKVFIAEQLIPLQNEFPALRIVLEHITTADAADYVGSAPAHVGATITPHHLLLNRNALFQGGIRPHHYCLPIIKRETHRQALLKAATSGNAKFFAGTDSAPHAIEQKHSACGCAGIYSAYAAIEAYAEAFDSVASLDKLEGFLSHFGADFYGLPRNSGSLTLKKEDWIMPETFHFGSHQVMPFMAGETLHWKVQA